MPQCTVNSSIVLESRFFKLNDFYGTQQQQQQKRMKSLTKIEIIYVITPPPYKYIYIYICVQSNKENAT